MNNDQSVFNGIIGEVIHTVQPGGKVFERYRRAPGTRLVIVSPDNKILITKEVRNEIGGIDLRLPGGKVCDSLKDYHVLLASGQDMAEVAKLAATKEALEETGLKVRNLSILTKANAGSTVEWDLYYFLTRDYVEASTGQQLEQGENIEVTWMSSDEILNAIAKDQMKEWRSVGVLLGLVLPSLK